MKSLFLKYYVLITLSIVPLLIHAQLVYPVVGAYKKKSAQGMAIWGDKAYLFNDGGHCRVLNLNSKEIVREFDLASSGKTMHVATACFGREAVGNNKVPVLYAAEFAGKSRCFVENITQDSSILVQTIEARERGKNFLIQCWVVDNVGKYLYSVSGKQKIDSLGRCPVTIRKYRLPKLSEGKNILLTEKDKKDQFKLDFPSCLQGATIRDGNLYIVTGFQASQYKNPRGKRSLKVISLSEKKIVNEIDLTYVTTNEPEGFDFFGNKALMYCGQEGGIYEIKYK